MPENRDEIKRLKTILDDVVPYEECKTSAIARNNYTQSVCKRLYYQPLPPKPPTSFSTKKISISYPLRPKVEIHYGESKKEEKVDKEEKKVEEVKKEDIEKKDKTKSLEIEIIKREVKEPEFIRIIPKEEKQKKPVEKSIEFKHIKEELKEIPEWKTVEGIPEWIPEEIEVAPFVYQGYTLYKRIVKLKSGKTQTIYFFSKKKPRSGDPCALPEMYTVGINKRSSMPYLQRKGKKEKVEYYEKDGYRLYTREVKLKSGKTQIIYFFSKKQPKSGRQCPLPEKYLVGINKRSGMPYLKRK